MYIVFSVILLILIVFFIINHFRKRRIICRVKRMTCKEKCCLLNKLSSPFGFCYDANEEVFVSRVDAFQRKFGYGRIYDSAAPLAGMVFDTQPVYFNYREKTWLIELWKGQYGINVGAEIGVYRADFTVPENKLGSTIFKAAADDELLPMNIRLYDKGEGLFCKGAPHWWLAGFATGKVKRPSDLTLRATVAFPDAQMKEAFYKSMSDLGYTQNELFAAGNTVRIVFTTPKGRYAVFSDDTLLKKYALLKSRIFCQLYLWVTSPFERTSDRLLYLYYYLPAAFRKTAKIKRIKAKGRAG